MAVTACPLGSIRVGGVGGWSRWMLVCRWVGREEPAPPTGTGSAVVPGCVHVLQDLVHGGLAGQQAGDPGAEGVVDLGVGPLVDGEGAVVLVRQLLGDRLVLR